MSTVVNSKAPKGEPIDESTGAVAKDSLAAESISAGGGFSGNSNPQVLGVKGNQSTLNNEDTTNAHVLHAAPNREERDIGEQVGTTKYPSGAGTTNFTGTASQEGYAGGPTTTTSTTSGPTSTGQGTHTYTHKIDSNAPSASASAGGAGVRPYIDQAPNYTADHRTEANYKVPGTNLKENEDIAPGKTTFTGDVGGPKDPGRLAEKDFQKLGDSAAGVGAVRDNAAEVDDENVYGSLRSSERA